LAKVKVRPGESLEQALRRFNRQVLEAGIIQEIRDREHYSKPSMVKKDKKKERLLKIKQYKRRNR